MVSQPDYDFVLQLHCDVLRDVQTRVLNASLLTNLALTSPISRVLAQTVSPFQMKAHWAKPELNVAEDVVNLSADVAGGARYFIEGINLTMDGQVGAGCRPRAVANDGGTPVVALAAPSPLDLHLGDLKLSYAGDDELPTWVDTAIERTLLRPTLCAQLMAPLANLPLNYLPDAVPLRLTTEPDPGAAPAEGLTLTDAAVSLDPDAESLTLAMRTAAHSTAPAPPPNLLVDHATANTVVALSERGLNRVLRSLCAQGLATGTTPQPDGPVSWRWIHVAASFTDHAIHLTGQLWHGESAATVDAELRCSLTPTGELSVHLATPDPQLGTADVLLDAWAHLLRRAFFAATRSPEPTHSAATEPDANQPLRQRFVIPSTDLSVDVPAVGLGLREGYLIALYAVPPDEQPLTLTLQENKPEPTIIQAVVPLQDAPGAPVTTELAAALADSSQPPYDYAWRTDQEPRPRQHHGPTTTVTKTPPLTMGTGEPQQLTTVTIKVIDILGQVGEAEVDAMYYPATAQQDQDQETRQDGRKETTAAPDDAGLIASMAKSYRKWKDRHKAGAAVLRVAGPAVVAAIGLVIGAASIGSGSSDPTAPTNVAPTTSAESPSSGDPAAPPGGSTTSNTQPDTNDPAGPRPPTNPGGPGSGGGVPGGPGSGGTGTFTPKRQLTVDVSDGGSVTGSGISCPPRCSTMVNPGESVTLTAQADSYYSFDGWGGGSSDTCAATTPTCTVVMNGDRAVSASFRSEIAPFIGTWSNIDPNTRSIPQVRLTQASPSTATLQVWGSCTPTWCDWGTTTATLSAGGLEAFYDHGFATRTIFISLSNGQLIVQIHTHFTDNSGGQDYDSTDIMNKT